MTNPIRVLLVEDNAVYRLTLSFLLGSRGDVDVVGQTATGAEAVRIGAELAADVAVVDLRLPDTDGTEAAAGICARSPSTSIVFLSASTGTTEQQAARASGWMLVRKDDGIESLVEAIRSSVRSST
jgi:DNA-binding NarL/FixJ family response regulator